MNKLLIGLLLVAAGAGAYFFLIKKDKPVAENDFKKEWIVGKWKTESFQPVKDSVQTKFLYEFLKGGVLLRSISDTAKADSLHYEWSKDKELVWKANSTDSAGTVFAVLKLNKDSLLLQGNDSVQTLYKKAK
jgi:hypothetical protein